MRLLRQLAPSMEWERNMPTMTVASTAQGGIQRPLSGCLKPSFTACFSQASEWPLSEQLVRRLVAPGLLVTSGASEVLFYGASQPNQSQRELATSIVSLPKCRRQCATWLEGG